VVFLHLYDCKGKTYTIALKVFSAASLPVLFVYE